MMNHWHDYRQTLHDMTVEHLRDELAIWEETEASQRAMAAHNGIRWETGQQPYSGYTVRALATVRAEIDHREALAEQLTRDEKKARYGGILHDLKQHDIWTWYTQAQRDTMSDLDYDLRVIQLDDWYARLVNRLHRLIKLPYRWTATPYRVRQGRDTLPHQTYTALADYADSPVGDHFTYFQVWPVLREAEHTPAIMQDFLNQPGFGSITMISDPPIGPLPTPDPDLVEWSNQWGIEPRCVVGTLVCGSTTTGYPFEAVLG